MEDEGIMALPQGQGAVQNQDLPAITSMDSYDAATTALGRVNPEQLTAYKQAIREAIAGLELSPAEIETLLEIVEYMSQNPGEYPQLLRQLIDQDYIDEGDLPDQYDPVYLGVMLAALNELKLSMSEGAAAPMQMSPEVEGLGPLPMAEGGLADMARLLAAQGRGGDTMLAHITPEEARLLKARGGAGTINPATGLPEFFIKKLFKGIKKVFKAVGNAVKSALKNPIVRVIASVALATVLGPTGFAIMSAPAAAATASAATTLGAGGNLKDALIASATSYFGAGGTIGGVNPAAAVTSRVGQYLPGGATGAIAKGVGAGVTGAGIGLLTGASPEEALRMGALQGLTTGAAQAFQNWRAGQPQVEQPTQARVEPVEGGGQQLIPESPPDVASGMGGDVTPPPAPAPGAAPTPPSTAPAAAQVGVGAPGAVPAAPTGAGIAELAEQLGLRPSELGAPSTTMERLGDAFRRPSFETIKNAFFVNPEATTALGRYVPAAVTTMGIGALTGGFKSEPVNESPLFDRQFTGLDYMRQNPGMFAGNLGRVEGMPAAYNPIVPTPAYTRLPVTTPPVVIPRGATLSPAGIVQPYNVAGLYGVPELAAPVQQPVYMADGGSVNNAAYQAALAAWNRSVEDKVRELMVVNPGQSYEQIYAVVTDPRRNMIPKPDPANYAASAATTSAAATTPTRQQRIETMMAQFMRDNPGMTAEQLRPMVEQRVDAVYYSTPTGSTTTPGTTTPGTTTPLPGSTVSASFGQRAATSPYNPAVPSMPERTTTRRTRADMLANVQPYQPRIGVPMMPRYNQPGLYLPQAPAEDQSMARAMREPDVPPTLRPPAIVRPGTAAAQSTGIGYPVFPGDLTAGGGLTFDPTGAIRQRDTERIQRDAAQQMRDIEQLGLGNRFVPPPSVDPITGERKGPDIGYPVFPGDLQRTFDPSQIRDPMIGREGPNTVVSPPPPSIDPIRNSMTRREGASIGYPVFPGDLQRTAYFDPAKAGSPLFADRGIQARFMNKGGQPTHFPRKTGPINGPGTGTSDSIPAMLSDGEFVFTAKAVRNAGGGSRRKGAKRMYALMKKLEGGPVKGDA